MEATKPQAASRASNVLLVDDAREPRQALALLLTTARFDVRQATDVGEARAAVGAGDVGIAVVKADLPDVNGFELCHELRGAHGTDIYLILRTTKQQLSARGVGADGGADDFLIEPVSDQELLARVETGRKMKQLQEKLAATHASLELLEVTDELTGAYKRRRAEQELEREVDRARRYGRPLSLVLLDIDEVRKLNDDQGREAGDRVIAEVGRVLRLSTRATDTVGRWGGEAFAIVLPETDTEQAMGAAEKMRTIVSQTAVAAGSQTVHVTVSGGIATFADNNFDSPTALVEAAAAALDRAKDAGRNRCVAYG
jgi:diguanylate cyclase (GGDEF)-like protein